RSEVGRAGLEPAGDPLRRRPVGGLRRRPEHDPVDLPAARHGRALVRPGHPRVHPLVGGRPARRVRPVPRRPGHRVAGDGAARYLAAVRRHVGRARGRGTPPDRQAGRAPRRRPAGVRVPGAARLGHRPAAGPVLRAARVADRGGVRGPGAAVAPGTVRRVIAFRLVSSYPDFCPDRRFQPTVALSPDGSRVAYADNGSGQYNLVVQPVDGGPARRLTEYTDSTVREVTWTPDSKQLVFLADTRGDEFYQLRR